MKTSRKVTGLASIVFCLLLLFAAAPSIAQCGPGGAGCEGCGGTCEGVACAVPNQSTPSPGYCTPEQEAAGGYEIFSSSNCSGSLSGTCQCYQPEFYEVTSNCFRTFTSSNPWEEPLVSLPDEPTCATSDGPMTPAMPPALH